MTHPSGGSLQGGQLPLPIGTYHNCARRPVLEATDGRYWLRIDMPGCHCMVRVDCRPRAASRVRAMSTIVSRVHRFPISAKIAAAFCAIFLIVLAVGIMALVRLDAISDGATAARDNHVPSARTLGQLRTSVRMYRLAEATLALLADGESEAPLAKVQLQSAAATVDKARAGCEPYITRGTA